jgi:hypothetical protein
MNPTSKPARIAPPPAGRSPVLFALLLLLLVVAALGWQHCDAFGSINIFKHRYPFYGGYGYGYPFWGGYGAGYGGINIGGWGRR